LTHSDSGHPLWGVSNASEASGVTAKSVAGSARADVDAAITAFVARHYDRLLGVARLVCQDTSDAADAVQIALEQAWRRRDTLRDDDRIRAWLDRIVAREALRVSRRRRSRLSRLMPGPAQAMHIEPADGRASQAHVYVALRTAFAGLSAEQRAVVALHLHLGYTIPETADIVGAPEETVRSRLRLARERLRYELEEVRT
jgi:RNA polymerase sigma-70 factor (ECF subfamily)